MYNNHHPSQLPPMPMSAGSYPQMQPAPVPYSYSQQPPAHAPAPPRRESAASSTMTAPVAESTVENGSEYSLEVCQQPVRARMCGFGDKDRRPITSPPCVRLWIKDAATGRPVNITDMDISYFVLSVDLWNEKGDQEVNLVRSSGTSPSISHATQMGFSHPPPNHGMPAYAPPLPPGSSYPMHQGQMPQHPHQHPQHLQHPAHPHQHPHQQSPYPQYGSASMPSQSYYTQAPPPPPQQHPYPPYANAAPGGYSYGDPSYMQAPTQPSMFTRNLIGSLSASAFKLKDCNDEEGIWFILQDLSVRTEGMFRLKLSFVNVGVPNTNDPQHNGPTALNKGNAPILATAFTDVFQVFSAKKFPGVIESTELSRKFAAQGIKIPIRKDGKGKRGGDDSDEDED